MSALHTEDDEATNSGEHKSTGNGSLIIVTGLGLIGTLFSLFLAYLGSQRKSAFALPPILTGCGFGFSWWLAFEYHGTLRSLLAGTLVKGGSTEQGALKLAARTLDSVLSYCFIAMLALLAYAAVLLKTLC